MLFTNAQFSQAGKIWKITYQPAYPNDFYFSVWRKITATTYKLMHKLLIPVPVGDVTGKVVFNVCCLTSTA